MAFNNSYTAVTGGTLSAAQWNTGVRDNFTALWPYTTAGDVVYATSSTTLQRLAPPANDAILTYDLSGTAPAWLPLAGAGADAYKILGANSSGTAFQLGGGLVTTGRKANTTPYSYSTAVERDVPSSSESITVNVISTIIVIGHLVAFCDVDGKHGSFWVNVDGSNFATAAKYGNNQVGTVSLIGRFINIAAGSVTVKLREKAEFGGNAVNVDQWAYTVFVIPE